MWGGGGGGGRTAIINSSSLLSYTGDHSLVCQTTRSKLVSKTSSHAKQTQERQIVRKTKRVIQESMNSSAITSVIKNRISWRKFNQMRKDECLDSQPSSSFNWPTPSRHHGSTNHLSEETKTER